MKMQHTYGIFDDEAVDAPTLPDSFTLRLKIPGKGLKDLVLNYPYVFEVAEPDDIELPQQDARDLREILLSHLILASRAFIAAKAKNLGILRKPLAPDIGN